MRVGLDLLYLLPGETGGREAYARALVPALLELAPELEPVAFVNREAGARLAHELAPGMPAVLVPVSPRSRPQWAVGELALLSLAARRARVELVHSLANFAPAWGDFRRVVTIHDLQYRAVPEALPWPMRVGTAAMMRLAARAADRIIAVSAAGRDEIVAGLGVTAERIDVVPNGVRRASQETTSVGVRERYALGERAVALTVATNLPHKNLPALLDALASIAPERRPVLVIAGHATDDGTLHARATTLGIADDVRLLGARSTSELDSLYAAASCLVLPTLHEGFGLPVIEAMARSLPVACSDIPALREVAGEAAVYFDPRQPAQIAARVEELLGDAKLSADLRERGLARSQRFTWESAAAGTIASYRRALGLELGTPGRPGADQPEAA